MRNQSKNSGGMSTLKLILIITGSIVAAAGIIFVVYKLIKKAQAKKALGEGCCLCDEDEWEFDDDILGDLRFDDEELCDCDSITDAVDEAIEAVESVIEE